MIKSILFSIIVVLLVGCKAQNRSVDETQVVVKSNDFDEEQLLERLETLSSDAFEGRRTGEKGNALARAYIIDQFTALQVPVFGNNYEHAFNFTSRNKNYNGVNVLAKIDGSTDADKYVVVSAHYDHLGIKDGAIYNGADDDASGIAALFAFAEYLKANPPKHTVIIAAFDAEELGLQGAKYFVEKMKDSNILVNINMDMISRSIKDELYVVGGRYNKSLENIIKNFENPTSSKLLVGHDGSDDKDDWTQSSDHGPFHTAGIPFLYFGDEDHPGYHEPTDDFKDITPEFYKNSVKMILGLFEDIDDLGL